MLEAAVGENLGCRGERVRTGTAAQLAGERFDPLSVLLVEPAPRPRTTPVPGIPDEEFARGEVPMTKREVRCMALSLMGVCPGETVWDVGAGTGSVAVELALVSPDCRVWAVERREEGCALIRENRTRFGAWNLEVVRGAAPAALGPLPAPQRVFIGGTGGYLTEILDLALDKSPGVLVCVSAIAVETLGRAVQAMGERGMDPQVTQIAAARSRGVGGLHMMMGQNPVWLITGRREGHA